jgi:hypothetical protein
LELLVEADEADSPLFFPDDAESDEPESDEPELDEPESDDAADSLDLAEDAAEAALGELLLRLSFR